MPTKTRYDNKTAEEILQQAAELQARDREEVTRQELVEMGLERGLSEQFIAEAEQRYLRRNTPSTTLETPIPVATEMPVPDIEAEERTFNRQMQIGFRAHAVVFILVNIFLLLLNLLITPGFLWFWIVILSWAPSLLIQGYFSTLKKGPIYDQMFEKWYARREARRLRRVARSAVRVYPPLSDSSK